MSTIRSKLKATGRRRRIVLQAVVLVVAFIAVWVWSPLYRRSTSDENLVSGVSRFVLDGKEQAALRRRAALGDANAAYKLYQFHSAVLLDERKAGTWLARSAELGNPDAIMTLASQKVNSTDIAGAQQLIDSGTTMAVQSRNKEMLRFFQEMQRELNRENPGARATVPATDSRLGK